MSTLPATEQVSVSRELLEEVIFQHKDTNKFERARDEIAALLRKLRSAPEPGGIEQRLRALADELVKVDNHAADQLHNIADGVKRRALTKVEAAPLYADEPLPSRYQREPGTQQAFQPAPITDVMIAQGADVPDCKLCGNGMFKHRLETRWIFPQPETKGGG